MQIRSNFASGTLRVSGMTLIEVTLVMATLLGIISVTFVGTMSYKEGANRAMCIQNVASVQKAMRCYCHFHELEPGRPMADLKKRIMSDAEFFQAEPDCPSHGSYVYHPDSVPGVGTLFMHCSIADHEPRNTYSW